MQERLMEILLKLLKEIDTSGSDMVRLKELSEKLKEQGISENEFDAALSWLTERLQAQTFGGQEFFTTSQSIRVLHPVERMILTAEAYGYLLQLEHANVIDKEQMEAVIDKAMSKGSHEVTLNDVKMITASTVFNPENSDWTTSSVFMSDGEATRPDGQGAVY